MPVHPRACGEQKKTAIFKALLTGSSPRVRGTVHKRKVETLQARFIPARAGNSNDLACLMICMTVHPRACGEQGSGSGSITGSSGSSPRVRGTGDGDASQRFRSRFIPARAGNSPGRS